MLFARGSGQNNDHSEVTRPLGEEFSKVEKESYSFFRSHADHFNDHYPNVTYKAVSVHDFPGKYDPVGYQAAPVGIGLGMKVPNTMNADASWVPGDYQKSVQHGVTETVGYLKDQIASCPDQYFIVGGYSQGAQVMGDALFQLTEQEQGKILGVGFFGDPKYIGSSDGLPIKVKPAISYPWRRGEATNKDIGMLEPRIPYIPQNMENRTLSWCSRRDIICAGWSAFKKNSSHSNYSESPIQYVVKELVNIAAPQLLALDRTPDGSGVPPVQVSKEDRERLRDVLFLVNDDSNESVLRTFKYELDPMLPSFSRGWAGTQYAAKSFGEHDYGSGSNIPRVDNIQSFLPLNGFDPSRPTFTSSNLSKAFISKYGSNRYIIGGGDLVDPYQLAIERGVTSTGWRDDPSVERNIIMIIDRPPKDPYEYNICNSTLRQWMHYPDFDGYKNCFTNYNREIWQKTRVPEACEKITMVILEDSCMNPLMNPATVQMNKRSLEDEIKLAQAYNVKISVVIPHKFDNASYMGNKLTDSKVRDTLRDLAHATGGTFIYYENRTQYSSTSLYDTLWQVFTKKPRSLDAVVDGNATPSILGLQTNTPTVLDVSRSGIVAQSYKWDFDDNGTWDETTQGPVTEHEFSTPTQGLFRVQALGLDNTVLAETRQAYTVTVGEEPTAELPALPEELTAKQQADGTTKVAWTPQESNELLVLDPETNLPVASAQLSEGSLLLPTTYDNVVIRVISEESVSEATQIQAEKYIPPAPIVVIEDLIPVEEEPTLVEESQQNNDELPIIPDSPEPTPTEEPQQEETAAPTPAITPLQPPIQQTENTPNDSGSVAQIPRTTNSLTVAPVVLQRDTAIVMESLTKPQVAAAITPDTHPHSKQGSKVAYLWILILVLIIVTLAARHYIKKARAT